MPGNFYDDVRKLAEDLIESGYAPLGEEVRLAVEAGSTSSEILMRLRKALEETLKRDTLSEELRRRVSRQLDAVNRVLP